MAVKRHFFFFAAVAAVLAVAGGGLAFKAASLPKKGLPLAAFYDKSDRRVTLYNFHGTPVLVNLWATWCLPCIKELPSLARLQKAEGGKFAVVAIALDRDKGVDDIAAFLKKHDAAELQVYLDKDREVPMKWKYAALPTSYLIDAHGDIVARYDGGYDWDKGSVKKDIDAVITAPR